MTLCSAAGVAGAVLIRVQAPRTHLSVMLATLLSDGRGAPVMSGGAWLTQDPVLPGRTGLLAQVCAGDSGLVLSALLHPVHLWPPVQGSEQEG